MKINFFKLFLLITILVLSSGDFFAQVNWTKYPGNPIITGGPSGSWNYQLFTPRVLYNTDLSRYEMWFCASNKSSGSQLFRPWQIGFAYSTDGNDWTIHPTPVLTPSAGQWDAVTVEEPCVIRENGQYKMWYSGGSNAANPTPVAIGYATSPDGINWTKHSGPVMTAGSSSWEAGGALSGFVIPYESGYRMWYSGFDVAGNKEHIGYATSVDGINWVRYQNNPVLSPGTNGQWDDLWIAFPSILYTENIYYMWYIGVGDYFANMRVGLATSYDGINWIKHPDNPVLKPTPGQWDGSELESASVMLIGDTLWAWYDGSDGSRWKIGLAKSLYTPLPLPPGTYTVGNGGNFATIQEAFDKLETDGVAGNVTLELIDNLYTAPTVQFGFTLNGPIPGAGSNSRVTIKPAENKNVVIEGNNEALLYLVNTSYVTFDGVDITGPTTLTIHTLQNSAYVFNDALDFINNSDHDIIQNINFIVEDNTRASGSGFWFTQTGSAPDSNLIQNNFVKMAGDAFFIVSASSSLKGKDNVIRGNQIGSETDSLISAGIEVSRCENSIIENNIVQNLKTSLSGTDQIKHGVLSSMSSGTIIRNNVIGNFRASIGFSSSGIFLGGDGSNYGSNNLVYNNMIYDIHSTSTQNDSRVSGIQTWYQNNPKIYYNSVYLSGTGSQKLGSAALYIGGYNSNVDAKNNILVNTRDESPYCASAIYGQTASILTSDYNDLFYQTNQYNCLVRIGSTNYNTLADWQATGKDLNSISEMPHFVAPEDLHIDVNFETLIDKGATPIAGIDTDFDGETRNATTPDIGADEFLIDGVEDEETFPTEFALEQNYPNPFNPSTKISWQVPVGSQQTLKIYDILGNEVTTLVNDYKPAGRYEIEFSASKLPSGVYFYQLKAGDYIDTKKMILLK